MQLSRALPTLARKISDAVSSRRASPAPPAPRASAPGSAISEGAAHGHQRRFVLHGSVSGDSAAYRAYAHGHQRSARAYGARRDVARSPRFEMKELGEVTMVSITHLADAFRELLG
jgi:hypothetical protein